MQAVAAGAVPLLEEHGERLARRAPQTGKVVRRFEIKGLVVQLSAGRFPRMVLEVLGKADFPFLLSGDVINGSLKLVRGIIPVESQRDAAFLVEKEQGRGELYLQQRGKILLAAAPAIGPRHVAVSPDIDGDGIEVTARLFHDVLLTEIDAHELPAVRASVLSEVQEHPLAFGGSVAHILAHIEKRFFEPGGNVDRVRAGVERLAGSPGSLHLRERESDQSEPSASAVHSETRPLDLQKREADVLSDHVLELH